MNLEDRLVRLLNRRKTRTGVPSRSYHLGSARRLIGQDHQEYGWSFTHAYHTFICGRTGKGKTTLLLRLMAEHFRASRPFLFVDFHGHATEQLLALAATCKTKSSIVLLDPSSDPVIGWNPLAAEQAMIYATVQELVNIFHYRLWPDAWGPRLEELLRNVLLALAEAKLTVVEAALFLSDTKVRRTLLQRVSDAQVRDYWMSRFERLSPSQKSLTTETVLNKLSVFHDPALKYVVGQRLGSLDFDRLLAQGQTLLVDLSGGRLRGNSYLLAALLVAKLRGAVYRRPANSHVYSVILDEFQEMVSLDTLDDYLRSFRKFGCAVYLATQHLHLSAEIKASVFANCHRFCCFATSASDATFLGREFGPPDGDLAAERLPELPTGEAMVKVRGEPTQLVKVIPESLSTDAEQVDAGRAKCLALGESRQAIEADFVTRLEQVMSDSEPQTHGEVSAKVQVAQDLPEGYNDV
jgi:hypothetical protein